MTVRQSQWMPEPLASRTRGDVRFLELVAVYGFTPGHRLALDDDAPVLRPVSAPSV